jgi:hypothetical protein
MNDPLFHTDFDTIERHSDYLAYSPAAFQNQFMSPDRERLRPASSSASSINKYCKSF